MFPETIYILGLPLRWFGIMAAVSIFLAYFQIESEMKRLKLPLAHLPDLFFSILAGAFFFARLLFVLSHIEAYTPLSWDVLKIWEGGLVMYGGLLGGLLGGFLYCRFQNISFAKLADAVAVGLALGLAVSRLGCFAAGCCFGQPTAMPWGIAFSSPESLASPLHTSLHPAQLYSFFAGMAVYWFLLSARRKKMFDGELILSYLILTSVSRLVLDLFRAETNMLYFSCVLIILGSSVFLYFHYQHRTQPKGAAMKNAVMRLACFCLVAFLISACGIVKTQKISRGLDISKSDVQKIEKGVSTQKDVIKLFGPPTKVRDTAEGEQFFYEYTKAGGPQLNLVVSVGGGTLTKTLMVWFDKAGVVTDYAYKAS